MAVKVQPPQDASWFVIRKPKPQAAVRLFCFPFAGGGASVFREWSDSLPENIELCAVQYPGRENRIVEQPISDLSSVKNLLFEVLLPKMDLPYAFFGHCLGAKIAFEVAKMLSRERGCHPVCLFVSGSGAPHLPAKHNISQLQGVDFINFLRRYAGTPEDVLQNEKLMNVLLPMLKADFLLDENFTSPFGIKVDCPIHAFRGTEDDISPITEVELWRHFTTGLFKMHVFKGDHFFLKNEQAALLEMITETVLIHENCLPDSWQ